MPIKQELLLECDLCKENEWSGPEKPANWAIVEIFSGRTVVICPACTDLIVQAAGHDPAGCQ